MPNRYNRRTHYLCSVSIISLAFISQNNALAQDNVQTGRGIGDSQPRVLEEILITAERREKKAQDTPIAVSVLTSAQLENYGISSLDALGEGVIPSLKAQPIGNTPSTLIIAIRGNGVSDATQITREAAVAIYQDGFYLGRTQGLSMELADPARIEVLHGPQGTLFGRNATGGAINVVSSKPTGEFGFRQKIGYGNYDALKSVTTLNLQEFSGISLKFDYIHSERDGWVNNTAEGQADYNAYNKDGGRVSLNWKLSDIFTLDYSYERTEVVASQVYFQLQQDNIGIVGVETGRAETTRFPITPLEPTVTKHEMHTLTLDWALSDHLTVKSLTSYREMDEENHNNYAGTLYFNGVIIEEEFDQSQFSQELQLIGTYDRFEWTAGLYHFEEDATQTSQNLFSLDVFGFITGTPLTPIAPTPFNLFAGANAPLLSADAKANSQAIYG
ncbi:MAG: TonB-dependent receptor [Kordiimonadaceae bacterium]|nr:TonB-dependent receptor [Kordiimonadaceae bacterium]